MDAGTSADLEACWRPDHPAPPLLPSWLRCRAAAPRWAAFAGTTRARQRFASPENLWAPESPFLPHVGSHLFVHTFPFLFKVLFLLQVVLFQFFRSMFSAWAFANFPSCSGGCITCARLMALVSSRVFLLSKSYLSNRFSSMFSAWAFANFPSRSPGGFIFDSANYFRHATQREPGTEQASLRCGPWPVDFACAPCFRTKSAEAKMDFQRAQVLVSAESLA